MQLSGVCTDYADGKRFIYMHAIIVVMAEDCDDCEGNVRVHNDGVLV